MNSAPIPASPGVADSSRAAEQLGSAVDTSLVTLPATRMSVDARGLALGVLAALALIFALSWGRPTGPSLSNKKIAVNILDDIKGSIQKYMFMLLTTSLLVSIPHIVIAKVVSQHVEQLHPMAELLGD